jgi:ABC-type branched-subunit amino acid transport system substrate-binding protein
MAFATAVLMVTALSAIAVVKADHKTAKVTANGRNAGGVTNGSETPVAGETNSAVGASAGATAGGTTAAGSVTAGGSGSAAPGAAGTPAGGAAPAAAAPGQCTDLNPSIGVFCDHFLVGGTTVLSGPLAVYGAQGLKGGQAWITYFNTAIAPKEHLRSARLIWYDDNLDPQKTLSYVQRLHDVDKVLYLGGVTSPEAISAYLQQTKFPMIGDIGLSPKSWTNRYIFPTTPSDAVRDTIRIKVAKARLNITSFAVIQDVLPSVDTGPLKRAWQDAAKRNEVKQVDYNEIASTASDCSGQFSHAISTRPDYLILPTASGAMLACLREARKFSVQPGGSNSKFLKGWSGGSNLQIEVDNCKPLCEGMYSIGTVFSDPRIATSPQMQIYRENMAKYAPDVDITSFITINYYHAGWIFYNVVKNAHIEQNLTRESILAAAEHFGPFDTGFGNSVQWTTDVPREPWTCGYPVIVKGDHWVFESQKFCY